jgi:hypothetical protein
MHSPKNVKFKTENTARDSSGIKVSQPTINSSDTIDGFLLKTQ